MAHGFAGTGGRRVIGATRLKMHATGTIVGAMHPCFEAHAIETARRHDSVRRLSHERRRPDCSTKNACYRHPRRADASVLRSACHRDGTPARSESAIATCKASGGLFNQERMLQAPP